MNDTRRSTGTNSQDLADFGDMSRHIGGETAEWVFGRERKQAERIARAFAGKVACPHVVLAPRWNSASDVGREDLAIGYACASCGEQFTPADAHQLRSSLSGRFTAPIKEDQRVVPSARESVEKSWREHMPRAGFGELVEELPSGLLNKVYVLLAFSLTFAIAGGFIGYSLDPGWIVLLFPVGICLILAVNASRDTEPLNLILLYGFTFISGMMVGPVVAAYAEAGYGPLVVQAFGATAIVAVGLAIVGLTIKTDLSAWGSFLLAALLGLIFVSVMNLLTNVPFLSSMISWGGAALFSLYLIFDVNRIRYAPDTLGNAVLITLDIYLDLVNLFLDILRILVEVLGSDD